MAKGDVGFMLFYNHDFRKDIDGLKEILSGLNQIWPDRPLNEFRCAYARRHGLTGEKSLNARNAEQLMKELAEGKYGMFLLSDLREGVPPGISASLTIYDGLELGDVGDAGLIMKGESIANDPTVGKRLVDYVKTMWRVVDGIYGFITVGSSRKLIVSETSTEVFREASQTLSLEEEQRYQESSFYSRNRNNHSQFIRKAYWGNLLNAKHVAELGGFKAIQADAPCFRVAPLPGGGAYLQLTESPLDFMDLSFLQKLKALDNFFQPVVLPGRPSVIFT